MELALLHCIRLENVDEVEILPFYIRIPNVSSQNQFVESRFIKLNFLQSYFISSKVNYIIVSSFLTDSWLLE